MPPACDLSARPRGAPRPRGAVGQRRAAVLASALLLLLSPAAGCYRYVPAAGGTAGTGAALPIGADLRLRLSDDGAARATTRLGTRTTLLAGRVETAAGDSIVLVVAESWGDAAAAPVRWVGERVTLPAAAVAGVERRALDRRRSLVGVGGVVLAIVGSVLALRAVSGKGSGETSSGGGPPP